MTSFLRLEEQDYSIKIDKDKPEQSTEREYQAYTVLGTQDFLDDESCPRTRLEDDWRTHAKTVQIGSSKRFYVKTGRTGRLFNPLGLYDDGFKKQKLRHASKPNWRMRETTEKVFRQYLEFLKTKNPAYLHNAERSVL